MRRCFLLIFILASLSLSAQQLVSEACAKQKQTCDSALRAIYGDVFYSCFTFDTATEAMTYSKNWLGWNDTITNDSVKWCWFQYFFQFPGARQVEFSSVPHVNDTGVILRPDQKNFPRCEKVIDSTRLDSIARKQLKQPLSQCEVHFYTEGAVGTDKHPVKLDQTHVYLTVDYATEKVKDEGDYTSTITHHYYIIVDACTGEVVEKPSRMKTRWTAPKH